MREEIRKYKDDYILLKREEELGGYVFWTWKEWMQWFKNAKLYRTEDDAREAIITSRFLPKKNVWLG